MSPDPLASLKDWHLPAPLSWWPPAPGWWILAGFALAGVLVALRWWWLRRRRGALSRAALRELEALRSSLATAGDGRAFVAAVSRLLRRLALGRYPREQAAGLCGEAWLAFLDATGGEGGFSEGPGRVLADGIYRADPMVGAGFDPQPLYRLAATWIRAQGTEASTDASAQRPSPRGDRDRSSGPLSSVGRETGR